MPPFAIAPLALATDSRLTLTDTRLLLGLLSFANDALTCWPSRKTLAERLGVSSVSRISETIARLESLGWLEVTRRYGSSMYRIIVPTDPAPPPLHPVVDAPPPPRGGQPEQTTDQTNKTPLPPQAGAVVSSASNEPVQPEPLALDQKPVQPEPQPDARQDRVQAAQRVVEHLNNTTGSSLPTGATSATVKRVARRLRHHTESELIAVVEAKAKTFRHPSALFKPLVVESVLAEIKATEKARQQRIERERQQIEQIRTPTAERSPESRQTALDALAAMRRMLGGRARPDDDGKMTA